jgi:hypothetical protein
MNSASQEPVLHCPVCYSTTFQTSKARPEDGLRTRLFKRPVRCKQCSNRIFASRSYARWLEKAQSQPTAAAPYMAAK